MQVRPGMRLLRTLGYLRWGAEVRSSKHVARRASRGMRARTLTWQCASRARHESLHVFKHTSGVAQRTRDRTPRRTSARW
jgi:hypothetical protein